MGENPNSTSKSVVSVTIEDIRLLHIYQNMYIMVVIYKLKPSINGCFLGPQPVGEGVMARGRERRPQRSKFVRIQFLNLDSKQLLVI
ncbi:uncharacterized protein LOC110935160 isoform X4 [Helianthus annuus]|uniref:uncharacterized protein LOC110935160 isoform X4 n=1 Tax=Helianthus annuus TaxID=4232 RepID=UPI000B901156|nr:uncharacterized protein LOC110935160 isoform X4 [Helianthus annuus]